MRKKHYRYLKKHNLIIEEPGARPHRLMRSAGRVLAAVVLLFFMTLLMLVVSGVVEASESATSDSIRLADVTRGQLLYKDQTASTYHSATLLDTQVAMTVTGMIVHAKVQQQFTNDTEHWQEGLYVFPLPEKSAVYRMKMQIGERIIEAEIKERQAAKKIYQQARQQGKKASLVEQQRPNMFTTSVANIGPGETLTVELEYQQLVAYRDQVFELRFPMAITPRYIPGIPLQADLQLADDGSGWARNTDQVPDASHITPPVKDGRLAKNRVHLLVELNAGMALTEVESPYHEIRSAQIEEGHYLVKLLPASVPADRDFVLRWQPVNVAQAQAALFNEPFGNEHYQLLMLMPPPARTVANRLGRDIIFVIDTSGSMAGSSIRQARRALLLALQQLAHNDRFNVIQFNSQTEKLFQQVVPADAMHVRRARRYVESLQAQGGTEMRAALEAALAVRQEYNGLRQVVFLTDGSVGNERALFDVIRQNLGTSRLFTIGIGSAPNSFFMRKAARFGRGSFTYIGDVSEVQEKMSLLFNKLSRPVLADIRIDWNADPSVEVWPKRIPDLYAGEPLLVVARSKQAVQHIQVSGRQATSPWKVDLNARSTKQHAGVARLWARYKIEHIMDQQHAGLGLPSIKQQVLALALRYHLVSRFTSLVAVDKTPSRPVDQGMRRSSLPGQLPQGQQFSKIFGHLPQTATSARLYQGVGTALLLLVISLQLFTKYVKSGGTREQD